MGNRTIQQKILKMKRRNRHAVFSGATTKYAVRIDNGKYQDVTKVGQEPNEDYVPSGKHVVIPVGPISLSKAVISTGRGPDKERMQEYYQRVYSYDTALPETLGLTEPMRTLKDNYARIIRETPREMRIRLLDDAHASLDLFFEAAGHQWFFVEFNKQKKFVRRSMIYGSKRYALLFLSMSKITWVEQLPK